MRKFPLSICAIVVIDARSTSDVVFATLVRVPRKKEARRSAGRRIKAASRNEIPQHPPPQHHRPTLPSVAAMATHPSPQLGLTLGAKFTLRQDTTC